MAMELAPLLSAFRVISWLSKAMISGDSLADLPSA